MPTEPNYDGGGRLQDLVDAAADVVKPTLAGGKNLHDFLQSIDDLNHDQMSQIVGEAIILLDSFYAHLPLKKAMHAVDPLQRLRLLQRRLPQISSELAFHHEMTEIFTSLRDLHTNYILPLPFSQLVAFLPFLVETFFENSARGYIVSKVADGFKHPTFVPGVTIRHWNGIPIERAVEIAASYHAGSNADARHARGVAGLTKRAMNVSPPPDEEWVTIGYDGLDGTSHETRIDWTISDLPPGERGGPPEFLADAEKSRIEDARSAVAAAAGAGLEVSAEEEIAAAATAVSGTDSTMPDVFTARRVDMDGKAYTYIRIRTFNVKNDVPFVNEFLRLLELPDLSGDGLILDVRANGGGLIWAGERLLQLFTAKTIEPTRFQFINSPAVQSLCQASALFKKWEPSVTRALETGATFSAAFPITSPEQCNDIGQRYYGPVVLITDARCYSTTDIFTAGFRDHRIGTILGVDGNTGAGGANVWALKDFDRIFLNAGLPVPLQRLPRNAGLRVAMRRTLRVGPEAGTELEDLGIVPDEPHRITRDDVLNGNRDLIAHACRILAGKTGRALAVTSSRNGGNVRLDLVTKGVDYVDVFSDGRPQGSRDTVGDAVRFEFAAGERAKLELRGYAAGELVCSRRFSA